jgi:uncharacterized phage-associated protein
MHSAIAVANEIIKRGASLPTPQFFTPMQLLKLVYLCHGWMLGLHNRPLIEDDVEAWKYGPVIPDLYHQIKQYRDGKIPGPLKNMWTGSEMSAELDPYESNVVDQVINIYGNLSGLKLSQITHAPNTPWSTTFKPDRFGLKISDDVITDHYQQLYRERTRANGAPIN